jgi:flagellar hook-basal body complex protein FliE
VNFDDLILELNAAADHWMNRAKVAEAELDRLARQVEAVKAVLAEWESAHCNLRQYIQLRNAHTAGPEQ